jgi:hypothetical protein
MIVTHDAKAAERAKTVLHLEKGTLLEAGVRAGAGLGTGVGAGLGVGR